jgi:hypothetical protein
VAITTTADDVLDIAPELAGQEPRITRFIEHAKLYVSEAVWGGKANFATALLTAHLVSSLGGANGAIGGEVKKKKVGDNEIEFAVDMSTNPHELGTTSYGKQYLALRRTLVLSPLVSGDC